MPSKITPLKGDFGSTPEEAYFTFCPRPDQPHRYDEQTSAYYSSSPGVIFIVGGNGAGTTELSLAKVAKFVLSEQCAPRHDTPFWIISSTFPIVCEVAWKEKLLGHGHIPISEIDWERIQWYKQIRGWPLAVPLKPWVNRPETNWVLEFKSYEQGRALMQARSIGGFCFIEQFPWPLLTEVFRGCREYSFRGNKICEFTPIVPGLTEELEEMIENDKLPPGWEVYRANTECALEAGHVSKEWFEEFFAMVPESMRATRMTGAMPTYEGAIYSTFNPKVHCVDICGHSFPLGVRHHRSIDWGSGPDNAMACVWYFITNQGQHYVYDEYYSTDLTMSVIDHLCAIQDQWPWPLNNPLYGLTWADPSAKGFLRIASRLSEYAPGYENMDIVGANNSVGPGIEHVQYLLKPQKGLPPPFDWKDRLESVRKGLIPAPRLNGSGYPALFIDKNNCRNLKREMRTYRWERKSETVSTQRKDAKPQPLKLDDHLCDALRYGLFSDAQWTVADMANLRREDRNEEFGIMFKGHGNKRGIQLKRRN